MPLECRKWKGEINGRTKRRMVQIREPVLLGPILCKERGSCFYHRPAGGHSALELLFNYLSIVHTEIRTL